MLGPEVAVSIEGSRLHVKARERQLCFRAAASGPPLAQWRDVIAAAAAGHITSAAALPSLRR